MIPDLDPNPYKSPADKPVRDAVGELTCPHCGYQFELTWKRYWFQGLGRFCCPACRRSARLRFTTEYVWKISLYSVVCYGPAMLPMFFMQGLTKWLVFGSLIVLASVIITLVDRALDVRRPLVAE